METFFDPSVWAHPGHGQAQGFMALTLLLVAASFGVATAAATRLRLIVARSRPSGPMRPPRRS
jgi:hypothetical protein